MGREGCRWEGVCQLLLSTATTELCLVWGRVRREEEGHAVLHSFSPSRKLYSCNSPGQVLGKAKKVSWFVFSLSQIKRETHIVRHILWTLSEYKARRQILPFYSCLSCAIAHS